MRENDACSPTEPEMPFSLQHPQKENERPISLDHFQKIGQEVSDSGSRARKLEANAGLEQTSWQPYQDLEGVRPKESQYEELCQLQGQRVNEVVSDIPTSKYMSLVNHNRETSQYEALELTTQVRVS